MNKLNYITLLAIMVLGMSSCSDRGYKLENDLHVIEAQSISGANTLGNLVATAIKDVNKLDIVLFPTELLPEIDFYTFNQEMTASEINSLVSEFETGVKDQMRIGYMKGSDIKELIFARAKERYNSALQVSGIKYDISFVGGITQYQNFEGDKLKLEDSRKYKIAVSEYFYFSGNTFPSYKYRNSMNRTLRDVDEVVSVKESITNYLKNTKEFPDLKSNRAIVKKVELGNAGNLNIHDIQGKSHISPYFGQKVVTKGVITAIGSLEWFPGGVELYIQNKDQDIDNDARTSEALGVYLTSELYDIRLGDEIEVSGTVYEEVAESGLSLTMIKDVTNVKVLSIKNELPSEVKLGHGNTEIPKEHFSTYRGNLNNKKELKLSDAIDFYESLEGMRISFQSPRIVGFRGGNEEFAESKPKGHLTLYVKTDGDQEIKQETEAGGTFLDEKNLNHNPEILQIVSSHLSQALPTDYYYKVGQVLPGQFSGVMTYSKNLFGGADYAVVLPQRPEAISNLLLPDNKTKFTTLEDRPKFDSIVSEDELTIATYNVENLAGNQQKRIDEIAKSVRVNLNCPDIVNFVEIQDFNGPDMRGGSDAKDTLKKLIKASECGNYHYVNVNPIPMGEGGQPGGNIRVAMIYNADRVEFSPTEKQAKPLDETVILKNGDLSFNPGRVYPNDDNFEGTRRSLISQFKFKGRKVFVIGNHFNSKLGDSDLMGAQQPFISGSDDKRVGLAWKINNFVQRIKKFNPDSYVFVLGDFNANMYEKSMQVLEGNDLFNLTKELSSPEFSYTTNHNGNSNSIDYIFASRNVDMSSTEVKVVHINSDYMGKLSDHDPVICKTKIK